MGTPPICLSLTVQGASDPITGSLQDGHGDSHPFRGWIELAAVLHALTGATESEQLPTQGDRVDVMRAAGRTNDSGSDLRVLPDASSATLRDRRE